MGFNTAFVAIQKTEGLGLAEVVEALLPGRSPSSTVPFDEAYSTFLEGTAVSENERWVIVIDPANMDIFDRPDLTNLSRHGRVAAFIVHSVSSTYAFAIYEAGAVKRQLLRQEGNVHIDAGAPDAHEIAAMQEEFEEDQTFAYAQLLGIPSPGDELVFDLHP